jgi:hypothetical protein
LNDLKLTAQTAGTLGGDIFLDDNDATVALTGDVSLHQAIVVHLRHNVAEYGLSGRNGSKVAEAIEAARGRLAPIDLEAACRDVLRRFRRVNVARTEFVHHPAQPGRVSFDCRYRTFRGREFGFTAEEVT